MKLDPHTKLSSLLNAIPSAAAVLEVFQIPSVGNESKNLEELCIEHGITFDLFLKELNQVNWNEEYPS